MKKKLFLIDGNSFCYRAFYAIRSLSTSRGTPTNAVYGVITMINRILKEEDPEAIAVVFDLKGPTFRHKKFKEYKAHRKPMPDDLVLQMPYIKDIIRAYNIPIFEYEGVEADDVIGTVTKKAENKGYKVFIVTSDKDAMQLINDDIKIYNTSKDNPVIDKDTVMSKYGITPSQIKDLLGIMGDSSDNIPGVAGIGQKGASQLISEFGSIEKIYMNIDKIKSVSKRKLLEDQKDMAILSKELVTLDLNVPIPIDFKSIERAEPNRDRLTEIFKELEFMKLLKGVQKTEKLESDYVLIDSYSKLGKLVSDIKSGDPLVLDLETTSVNPIKAVPVGISFSFEEGKAYYVPFNMGDKFQKDRILKTIKPVLENKKIPKAGQNIKYDYIVLRNCGIEMKGIYFDTMVASYLINPSRYNHNLDDLAMDYLNYKTISIDELIGTGKQALTMDRVDVEKVCRYSCEDSDVTYRLMLKLKGLLAERGLNELFHSIEMPLIEVLAQMELDGIKTDVKYLNELSEEMQKNLEVYMKDIYTIAGEEFNIKSPKQLQVILFEKGGMPVIKRTKTGPSTDEEVLKALSVDHELPGEILKFRGISKLKSTYADALPKLVNEKTGRIHTSFNQTITATGRLSSSDPNLQNIPIKTDEGKKIRKAFIAGDPKSYLLSADYSQIELRILAHLSGDKALIKAFKTGRDIHAFTASLVYEVDEEDVTSEMRGAAKTVNFGIIYGMSAFGLSKDLGIRPDEAKVFIDNYFDRYPSVKRFMDSIIKDAKKNEYVKTIMNRRRNIPDINSENGRIRGFAERTAINTPIQGSAADIIKKAMINIHKELSGLKSRMLLQVHDELVFDVPENELKDVCGIVKKGMENVVELKVPIEVNMKYGRNWLEMDAC